MTRLALYGNFGRHNIGNECTLGAVLVHLRTQTPEPTIFCVCSDPVVVGQEHSIEAIAILGRHPTDDANRAAHNGLLSKLRRLVRRVLGTIPRQVDELWRAHRLLKGADALVLVGTGMLEDEDGDTAWPLAVYRWTLAARLRRCRVIVLGIGAGPFQTWATRALSGAILRGADYISYRDQESKDCVGAAGIDTTLHQVVPDLAFSLPVAASPRARGHLDAAPAVAIGVIDRSKFSSDGQHRAYLETLCAFAESLIEEGHTVRLIHGDGLYDRESVAAMRSLFAGKVFSDEVGKLSIPSITSFDDLLRTLDDVDIVVASRYHNMVLALMLGKPVLALSYHWKFASVMSQFSLSRYVRPVHEFDLSWLVDRSRELLAARNELGREIRRAADACRESVMNQYRVVWELAQPRQGG
jgi:polysaccharide pyruvyl transferase WcaK-like protein